MDLKSYQGHTFLHFIDMCTHLSAALFAPNKKKDTILKVIFHIWIAVYGSPDQILVNNGLPWYKYPNNCCRIAIE